MFLGMGCVSRYSNKNKILSIKIYMNDLPACARRQGDKIAHKIIYLHKYLNTFLYVLHTVKVTDVSIHTVKVTDVSK